MHRSGSARRAARLGLLVVVAASGCGPVSTTLALRDADNAIAAARAVDAQRYAVYELTGAEEYVRKAREEEGYSDFQAAIDLAREAQRLAVSAAERARKNPARGRGPTVPDPTDESPDARPAGSHL